MDWKAPECSSGLQTKTASFWFTKKLFPYKHIFAYFKKMYVFQFRSFFILSTYYIQPPNYDCTIICSLRNCILPILLSMKN